MARHKVDNCLSAQDHTRMLAAIPFPNLRPEIFSVNIFGFELALRWYALAYIVGILIAWRMMVFLARRPNLWGREKPPFTAQHCEDFITWIVLGIVLGGRIGYVLFYKFAEYMENPIDILKVWTGGMSFHGGFLGMAVAIVLFARINKISVAALADAAAFATPPGLLLGRLANFVNAELWGHPSDVPWAVIFPGEAAQNCGAQLLGACARHPSQLYEAGLEGLLLGLVLFLLVTRWHLLTKPWAATGVFFAGYGASRFFVEFFRQADAQFISRDNPMGYVV
ncbi:MAG: prolipoprotein diacylglyceryl transferase, partial [Deltaproteobacteria bacterium]